jgi:LacI family transcriptional regulator
VPASSDQSYLRRDLEAGLAVVFVDRPPTPLDADCVLSANSPGAALAVRHLLDAGHRRIGYVGDSRSIYTARERHRGYVRALRAAGIEEDETIVRRDISDADAARVAVEELVHAADPPTAIFAGNNRCTIGAVRALYGQRLPVALVGYDDFELADLLDPPVTVVANDALGLGRAAAERLFARIDGNDEPPRRIVLPARLIVRGSGTSTLPTGRVSPTGGTGDPV